MVTTMQPEEWVSATPGMGSCFHQALHRWALLRQQGESFKIALGIVRANERDPHRHIHAWLQRGNTVISAVTGDWVERFAFYDFVGIEPGTVHLVNPRSIMRERDGVIDRETVRALLDSSGLRWRVSDDGGILPA